MRTRARHDPCPRSEAGFTLIELLVTLVLLGMLSLALLGGIRYGTRLWRTSANLASQDSAMLVARARIKAMLETAYPEFLQTTALNGHIAFAGTPDSMDFLTPDASLPGSLAHVRVFDAEAGDGRVLAVTSAPELSPNPPIVTSRSVLLRGVDSVAFAYYGKPRPRTVVGWYATWRNATAPPRLVRLRVAFADPHARPWPELIVAMRVAADESCTFDAFARSCIGR